jgi:hypothetical protein
MTRESVADCGTIFQGSLSALRNRPNSKSHLNVVAIICRLWKLLKNTSDDQNGFVEWAIQTIEKEVGHGEFPELRMIFQSFSQEASPLEPETPIVHCLAKIIEPFQTRE